MSPLHLISDRADFEPLDFAELAGGFATDQPIPYETEDYGFDSDSDLDESEEKSDLDEGWGDQASNSSPILIVAAEPDVRAQPSSCFRPRDKVAHRHAIHLQTAMCPQVRWKPDISWAPNINTVS